MAADYKQQQRDLIAKEVKGKLQYERINPTFVEGLADVVTKGAEKYSETHLLIPDMRIGANRDPHQLIAALERHTQELKKALQRGELAESVDPDLGTHHIHNATCNLMMLHNVIELESYND